MPMSKERVKCTERSANHQGLVSILQYGAVAEWSNATDCKSVKSSVQI